MAASDFVVSRVGAVVALKPLTLAKSRMAGLPAPLRQRLVWLMAVDTLRALSSALDHVLVISNQPALHSSLRRIGLGNVEVLDEDPTGGGELSGLNPALRRGDTILRRRGFDSVLACVSDLPAATPNSIRRVLSAATAQLSRSARIFLSDAQGTGTAMLMATGASLDPQFEGASTVAHLSSGAHRITDSDLDAAVGDLRTDVDDTADLAAAFRLGLGRATQSVIDPARGTLGSYSTITEMSAGTGDIRQAEDGKWAGNGQARQWTAVTAEGHRVRISNEALMDGTLIDDLGLGELSPEMLSLDELLVAGAHHWPAGRSLHAVLGFAASARYRQVLTAWT